MGSFRDTAAESRARGFVWFDQIKGKAHFVWWSWDGCAGTVRRERMFQNLYEIPAPAE